VRSIVLLEKLQPFERAVFLLREVFEYEFAEIADILEKTETACEILRSRGAEFITPPAHCRDERRAFFHDPDGHLLEIWEAREA
jgi:catechol 2,3-dioxygenase-like lactoylglutathione lyase family enzyme